MKKILIMTVLVILLVIVSSMSAFAASTSSHHSSGSAKVQNSIGESSNDGPSVIPACDKFGDSYVTYIGTDGHVAIQDISSSMTSSSWETSASTPVSTCFDHNVWTSWRGSDGHINLASWAWVTGSFQDRLYQVLGGKATLDDTSDNAPALATCNGHFYLGWVGTDPSHHLNIRDYGVHNNINAWDPSTKVTLTDYTRSGVGLSLACVNNQLYVAWLASSGTPHFYLGAYTGSSQLRNSGQVGSDYSGYRLSISASSSSSNTLEFFWKGYTNNFLYRAYYFLSNSAYSGYSVVSTSYATLYAPSVGGLETAYTGTDHNIYFDYGLFFS